MMLVTEGSRAWRGVSLRFAFAIRRHEIWVLEDLGLTTRR
jgi:hypothetical protein